MLRITISEQPRVLSFRLEGRLYGPWTAELEKCWRAAQANGRRRKHRVDLSGVTFIDAAGKAVLAQMHEQGAELVAGDCLTKAIVEEIAAAARPSAERGVI
jgi:anti-anti-sigma regulatory factor